MKISDILSSYSPGRNAYHFHTLGDHELGKVCSHLNHTEWYYVYCVGPINIPCNKNQFTDIHRYKNYR